MSKLIKLRGLGGCLKTSLIQSIPDLNDTWTCLSGTTREVYSMYKELTGKENTNIAVESIISKYVKDESLIKHTTSEYYITERSLSDYAFMNNNINPNIILDYDVVRDMDKRLDDIAGEGVNFVIKLSDEKFIKSIMSKNDIRSNFYNNDYKLYLDVQERYIDFLGLPIDYEIKKLEDFSCELSNMYNTLIEKI